MLIILQSLQCRLSTISGDILQLSVSHHFCIELKFKVLSSHQHLLLYYILCNFIYQNTEFRLYVEKSTESFTMLLQPTSVPPRMMLKSESQSGLKGKYDTFIMINMFGHISNHIGQFLWANNEEYEILYKTTRNQKQVKHVCAVFSVHCTHLAIFQM